MPRLLIVDDERSIRTMLSFAFVRAGYDVRSASDSFEAMALLEFESFDAVLSDVQMPGMDGHAFVKWAAKAHPTVHVVLMSGYSIDCGDCAFAGRCTVLQKPFAPSVALAAISQAMNSQVQ